MLVRPSFAWFPAMLVVAATCVLLGCSLGGGSWSDWVVERAQAKQHTVFGEAGIAAVESAGLDATGELLVCLRLSGEPEDAAPLTLTVPLTRLGPLASRFSLDPRRDAGFSSDGEKDLRFRFFREDLAVGCPFVERAIPVVRSLPVPPDQVAPHLVALASSPPHLVFQSAAVLWQDERRLELVPTLTREEDVVTSPGKPAYWLVYPFALAADLALLAAVYSAS
jgi:hypothetical protein